MYYLKSTKYTFSNKVFLFNFSGEMCMSLLWYYRPEHLDCGRRAFDTPDEIYASRHRDHTSVACIEDKCYVMTFNEYCRYVSFFYCRTLQK